MKVDHQWLSSWTDNDQYDNHDITQSVLSNIQWKLRWAGIIMSFRTSCSFEGISGYNSHNGLWDEVVLWLEPEKLYLPAGMPFQFTSVILTL